MSRERYLAGTGEGGGLNGWYSCCLCGGEEEEGGRIRAEIERDFGEDNFGGFVNSKWWRVGRNVVEMVNIVVTWEGIASALSSCQ